MATKFLIIGGGIGGLMAGIALEQAGFYVEIFEQAEQMKRVGAGITVSPNGMSALAELGLAEQVKQMGNVSSKGIAIVDERGRPITKLADEVLAFPIYAIHRADLQDILASALKKDTLQFGKRCCDVGQDDTGVVIRFEDGTEVTGDYAIVADGIHSSARDQIFGRQKLRYADYTCWRGIAKEWPDDEKLFTETWGTKGRVGIVPLANGETYWFAVISATENSIAHQTYELADLIARFGSYHTPVQAILEATDPEKLIRGDIFDLVPMTSFVKGRIVLLGDAAHAMTPNMGQGGCQAMEDAIVLQNCVKRLEDVEMAFEAYSKARVGRTKKITERSRLIGKVGQFESAFACKVRNVGMRLAPASAQRKQLAYVYEVDLLRPL
ncbi:NAD(P)-binding protein [Listeria grandensis]|uniref:NAD(P)-binding protein n=1 Tax=Listeria grandensis TaxID=1494963 RepID=A0A7X0Y2M9_9LIST|nr:FAD-dependent monooxygenase [Listeria grandensis]MBC1935758.1 NAD(P)-binding protein [Listeria grandensis]